MRLGCVKVQAGTDAANRGEFSGRTMDDIFSAALRGGASHVIYGRIGTRNEEAAELIVLRVLADRMDPDRPVRSALNARPKSIGGALSR